MSTTLSRENESECEYSIILGGRVGVGKTSLYQRLLYDSYSEDLRSASHYEDGLERGVYCTKLDGREVKVSLWDTGGLERYTSMTANYFRNCHAIVLVYSLEEEDSLFVLRDWLAEARVLNSDRVVPALWGNKSDSEDIYLTLQTAAAFGKENDIPAGLVSHVSARSGDGVRAAFENLVKTVHVQFEGQDQQRGRILEPLIDSELQGKPRGCSC